MIKFRQKEFLIPLVAAAPAVLGALGTAAGVGTMVQTGKQMKQAEKHSAQATANADKVSSALNNIAKGGQLTPEKQEQISSVMSNYKPAPSSTQRAYSLGSVLKGASALGKSLGAVVGKRTNVLVGGTLAGVGIGAAGYGADKIIQRDIKKSEITPTPVEEKTYSVLGKVGSTLLRGAKANKGMVGVTATLTAAPMLIGHFAQKKQLKDQIASTKTPLATDEERTYSFAALGKLAGSLGKSVGNFAKNNPKMMGGITKASGNLTSKVSNAGSSIKEGFKGFIKEPGKKTLSGLSSLTGGGGSRGVNNFGRSLEFAGKKNGSQIAQKAGKFIQNNPKTAMAASVPVGLGVMTATWDVGQNLTEKGLKAVDKNAFKHRDSQNTMIS